MKSIWWGLPIKGDIEIIPLLPIDKMTINYAIYYHFGSSVARPTLHPQSLFICTLKSLCRFVYLHFFFPLRFPHIFIYIFIRAKWWRQRAVPGILCRLSGCKKEIATRSIVILLGIWIGYQNEDGIIPAHRLNDCTKRATYTTLSSDFGNTNPIRSRTNGTFLFVTGFPLHYV